MKKYSEKNYYINTPEYDRHFWDAMRGDTYVTWIPGIQHYEFLVSMPETR